MAHLTTLGIVGNIANMKAELLFELKEITPEGGVIEMRLWRVPVPVPPTEHGYKYRLYYGKGGVRIVGFDNERGKGDHCHLDGQEFPYDFRGPDRLIADFMAEVAKRRG